MSEITFDYAQIGSVKLHYTRAGSGEKLVVLLPEAADVVTDSLREFLAEK